MNEQDTNKNHVCERCEKDAKELFECGNCKGLICDNCNVRCDQFSQINYPLCKECISTYEGD